MDGSRPVPGGVDGFDGARRRRYASVLFTVLGGSVTVWATLAAVGDGFGRPYVSLALGLALVGANLAPVVAVSGGRIDAFTPVGALLVPIGLLLPLPEAVLVYALGEGIGVLAAHRWDRHVGGPESDASTRTAFVIGKSIVGAALGLVGLQAAAALGEGVPVQVLAAFVGVTVSTAFDHTTVAVVSSLVGGRTFLEEFRRGVGELTLIGTGEVVAGALIAVLATRDPWSLLLGLAMLALLLVAGSAYARAAADREDTRELLRLAEELQEADTIDEVDATLIASVRRMLPLDEVRIDDGAPGPEHRSWTLDVPGRPQRWLASPRIVDTRDYEQQPMRVVDAAVSLARVALTRAAAQEGLVEQDRLRSLVLSTVAHDLRSPLAVASGGLEMLQRGRDRLDEASSARLLDASVRAVDRIRRLIDDLLGLEIAEERGRARDRTAIGEVVRDLVADLGIEDVTVEVDIEGGEASVDPVSLERIVENLVMNACKYSPPGGTVRIRCAPADGGATVVVEDEGPGVAAVDRQLIFEPFEQAGRERGGVGLGLYVARRFVELHGGRIWVGDAHGGGAAFHVWLPAATTRGPAEPPS